eukprot:TRINITY_DN12382_c0_g6_i1.p1 TRINITY_DN12382_c0_g6~~TRINITY_DN12382_c0_g6_i1.p1  ORF type:complete len:228 (+),score=36.79 TRINITY_DN12382_c0_g6_i1:54-737(+)
MVTQLSILNTNYSGGKVIRSRNVIASTVDDKKETYKTPRIKLNFFVNKPFDKVKSKALLFSTSTPVSSARKKNGTKNLSKPKYLVSPKQRRSAKSKQTDGGDRKVALNQSLTKQRNALQKTGKKILCQQGSKKSKVLAEKSRPVLQNNKKNADNQTKIRINSKLHLVLKKLSDAKGNGKKKLARNTLQHSNLSIPLKRRESDCMTVIENDCDNDYSLICNSLNLFNS